MPIHLYTIYGTSVPTKAEPGNCNKDCWPAKLKIPTLWPCTESLWTPHRELDITASRPCRASFSDSQRKCAGNTLLEECTQHRQPPWKCSKSGLLLLGSGPGGLPRAPLRCQKTVCPSSSAFQGARVIVGVRGLSGEWQLAARQLICLRGPSVWAVLSPRPCSHVGRSGGFCSKLGLA